MSDVAILNQNKQLVEKIKSTVALLRTGERGAFYSLQKGMFMILPTIVVYILYAVVFIFFAFFLVYGLKQKSFWGFRVPCLIIFIVYPFCYAIVSQILSYLSLWIDVFKFI